MLSDQLNSLLKDNKWDECIQYISDLPTPLNNELLGTLAWCYSRAGNYSKAIMLYDEMINREPQKAKWRYAKGYQFYMQKDWENAITNFSEALDLYKDYFVVKYRIAYACLQLSGVTMQWSKDTFWKAIRHLEECHQIYSTFDDAEKKRQASTYADICALHGKSIMSSEKYIDKSIELLKKANELKSDNDLQYELAKAYYLQKNYEKALDTLPNIQKPYYIPELKSQILTSLGKYADSNKVLIGLVKYRKKDYLYRRLAKNYLLLGKLNEAQEFANKAISSNNSNYKNFLAYGYILKERGQYKSSVLAFENARTAKQNLYKTDCPEALVYIEQVNSATDGHPTDKLAVPNNIGENKSDSLSSGTIVKYVSNRGFGFIKDDQYPHNIFFHISNYCNQAPQIGARVKYTIIDSEKGKQAVNISLE